MIAQDFDPDLFWQHVEMGNAAHGECWIWRGRLDREGRPSFAGERAERWGWRFGRPLAAELGERQLEPRCSTGAGCVNPDHWMLEARPGAEPARRQRLPVATEAPERDEPAAAPLVRVEASAIVAPARAQGVDGIHLAQQLLAVVSGYLASNPGGLEVVRGAVEDLQRTIGRA